MANEPMKYWTLVERSAIKNYCGGIPIDDYQKRMSTPFGCNEPKRQNYAPL